MKNDSKNPASQGPLALIDGDFWRIGEFEIGIDEDGFVYYTLPIDEVGADGRWHKVNAMRSLPEKWEPKRQFSFISNYFDTLCDHATCCFDWEPDISGGKWRLLFHWTREGMTIEVRTADPLDSADYDTYEQIESEAADQVATLLGRPHNPGLKLKLSLFEALRCVDVMSDGQGDDWEEVKS